MIVDREESTAEIPRNSSLSSTTNTTTTSTIIRTANAPRTSRIGIGRRTRSFSNPRGTLLQTKTFSPKHLFAQKKRLQLSASERQQLMPHPDMGIITTATATTILQERNSSSQNEHKEERHDPPRRRSSWHSGQGGIDDSDTASSWNLHKEPETTTTITKNNNISSSNHETSSLSSSSDFFTELHGDSDDDEEDEDDDPRNRFAQERSVQLIPEPDESVLHDWQTQVFLQQHQNYQPPQSAANSSYDSKSVEVIRDPQLEETASNSNDPPPPSDGDEDSTKSLLLEHSRRFKLCTHSSERIKALDPTINYSDTSITLLQALEKEAHEIRNGGRSPPDSSNHGDGDGDESYAPRRRRSHSYNTNRSRSQTILPSQVAKSTNDKRVQFQRWDSYKMQKSHNQEVEAQAKEVGSLVPTQPTPFLSLLEKELIKHHQDQHKNSSQDHHSSKPKSCLCRRDDQTDHRILKRKNFSVRFAINPSNGNAWCLTQTYLKVPSKLHHRLWYSSDELHQTYNEHYDEIPEETEDAYAELLEMAYESVDFTRPTCTDPDLPFAEFMACSDARGLEARAYAISDFVQRHREAVLDTQQLLYEESWVGGMDDDLQQEVLRLRSFKYSHPCRMMCQKIAEYDRRVLDLYREHEQSMYGSLYDDDSDMEHSVDADFISGKEQ